MQSVDRMSKIPSVHDAEHQLEFVFYSRLLGITFSESGVVERIEPIRNGLETISDYPSSDTIRNAAKSICHFSILSDEMFVLATELQEKQVQDRTSFASCATAVVAAPLSHRASLSAPVAAAATIPPARTFKDICPFKGIVPLSGSAVSSSQQQTETQRLPAQLQQGRICKILCNIECDGVYSKRLWRTVIPNRKNVTAKSAAEDLQGFKRDFLDKYFSSDASASIRDIEYTDAELAESFSLDEDTWEEFVAQDKKCIAVKIVLSKEDFKTNTTVLQCCKNDDQRDSSDALPSTIVSVELDRGSGISSPHLLSNVLFATDDIVSMVRQYLPTQMCPISVSLADLQIIVGSQVNCVNDVMLKWMPKTVIPQLLNQQQRPIYIEFNYVAFSEATQSLRQRVRLQESTFTAKYSHPVAKPLRKHVDKLLCDFHNYDWNAANELCPDPKGKPQDFVRSVYRYIENELLALGVFDNTKSQGGGVPNMGEEQVQDLEIFIENLVFSRLFSHIMKHAPSCQVPIFRLQKSLYAAAPDHISVHLKLAYLGSFLTLDNFGFRPQKAEELSWNELICDKYGNLCAEWHLACCLLHKACDETAPNKIMKAFTETIKVLECCLDGLIRRMMKRNRMHLNNLVTGSSSSKQLSYLVRDVSDDAIKQSDDAISADDLLPAISYLIVAANPPKLETALWLCTEFAHSCLRMGEDAYMLAQISSAFEYCKNAADSDFDISTNDFSGGLSRFHYTQELIVACRRGQDVSVLSKLLSLGADINGYSKDQYDTALTAAVRGRYDSLINYLLTYCMTDVDRRIDPYGNTSSSGFTALMLAAISGYRFGVIALLDAGADRTLRSNSGETALVLASGAQHVTVMQVLFADPDTISIFDCIMTNNIEILIGLLAQSRACVNETNVLCGGGTALHYAVEQGRVKFVEILSQCPRVNVNATNASGGTPLIQCSKVDSITTEDIRVTMALHLLRAGASRDIKDSFGRSAYDWALGDSGVEGRYPILASILKYDPKNNHICELAKDRDAIGVRALLLQGVDVNSVSEFGGYTPLIAAVYNSDYEMCKHIITYGNGTLDINKPDRNSLMTPLHFAAQVGDIKITALLLKNGANRHAVSRDGWTPLEIAQLKHHASVCDCLQFDPSSVSITLAAKHDDWRVMSALLVQGVNVNERKCHSRDGVRRLELDNALIAAAAFGRTELVKKMLHTCKKEINVNIVNTEGQSALMYAAACGAETLVLVLLENGCNRYLVANDGTTALDWARRYKQSKIVDILRYDPRKCSVHHLIAAGSLEGSVALFKQGVDPNVRWDGTCQEMGIVHDSGMAIGDTPLVVAARANQLPILALLLKAPGVDINGVDSAGRTPLFHAAANGHEECVLFLLRKGANRRALDYNHQRASDLAMRNDKVHLAFLIEADPKKISIHDTCANGKWAFVHALLKQGVSCNVRDDREGKHLMTPLHAAVAGGQLSIVKYLLSLHDIQIDGKDDSGRTALMIGAGKGFMEILLAAHCDHTIVDNDGKTADDYANDHGLRYVIFCELLQSSMRMFCEYLRSAVNPKSRRGFYEGSVSVCL